MDNNILLQPNLLKAYEIDLRFDEFIKEKNIKSMKEKIDRMIRLKTTRNLDKKKRATEAERIRIDSENEALKEGYVRIMQSNDLSEIIFFYIQNAYSEYSFSLQQKASKANTVQQREDIQKHSELLDVAYSQLSTPEDVKLYIDFILPLIDGVDISKMNMRREECNLDPSYYGNYKCATTIYPSPILIMDSQTDNDAIRAYSFGAFQYRSKLYGLGMPYEILGIVKKDSSGQARAYSGLMFLRDDVKVNAYNSISTGNIQDYPKSVPINTVQNGKTRIETKYGKPKIPQEKLEFFKYIVFSDFILNNAMQNNYGFIGDVVEPLNTDYGRYGNYRLEYMQLGTDALIKSLIASKVNPGVIKGMDISIYGNNIAGALLMAKYAALATGEKMEYRQKEKNEITQGE